MRRGAFRIWLAVLTGGILLLSTWYLSPPEQQEPPQATAPGPGSAQPEQTLPREAPPGRAVLDIMVHTLDELKVLLDRAEQLSGSLLSQGGRASVVLVLHGPEVEFFASSNYQKYKDVVDQAARLDAFDIVDVKICQTMMSIQGVARDDIPAFIEQVPLGQAEIDRLVGEGYVYF